MQYGVSATVNFLAWDTGNNIGKTGDSANFTLRLIKDGGAATAPTNAGSISEPDSTNMPGVYEITLTATEMEASFITLAGVSSTSDIVIYPLFLTTTTADNYKANVSSLALEATLADMKGATFSTTTDSLEAIRNRGDSAWITGGGAGGSSTVTITIQDQDTNPVPNTSVQIWNTGDTVLISYATTDSNGQVVLSADDGSYIVKIVKAGYTFSQESLTVSGNTTQTYSGSTTTIPATSDPTLCRVYEYIRNQDGTFPDSFTGYAKIVSLPYDYNTSIYSGAVVTGTYNSTTGLVYWDIPRLSTIQVKFTNYGYNYENNITVPDAASGRISDI